MKRTLLSITLVTTIALTVGPPPAAANHCLLGQDGLLRHTPLCPNNDPSVSGPWGPTELWVNTSGEFCATYRDPDGDAGKLTLHWSGYPYDFEVVDVRSGETACRWHSYGGEGRYCVYATVRDNFGSNEVDSGCHTVTVRRDDSNRSPNVPIKPAGPTTVYAHTEYTYCTWTTDPDGDDIQYVFDFDDYPPGTTTSEWRNSGQVGCVTHSFALLGSHCVSAYAQDLRSPASGWSECLRVTVN